MTIIENPMALCRSWFDLSWLKINYLLIAFENSRNQSAKNLQPHNHAVERCNRSIHCAIHSYARSIMDG